MNEGHAARLVRQLQPSEAPCSPIYALPASQGLRRSYERMGFRPAPGEEHLLVWDRPDSARD